MSERLHLEDHALEWLEIGKTINFEAQVNGKWYQGFLELQEVFHDMDPVQKDE